MTRVDNCSWRPLEDLDCRNSRIRQNAFLLLLCLGAAMHILCVMILASVPPVSRDALIHHLALPKMYLIHGGIYEIPSMIFAYYPMNVDMLYMIALYFKNDIVPKYIHFLFALMTAGLLYKYLKDTLNRTYGLMGALFFLTIPVIVKLSITAYVDLGLVFFTWACLYFFLKWYDTHFTMHYLVVAGVACGLALGTKYNGLILLFIGAALVPLAYALKINHALPKSDYLKRYQNAFKGLLWGLSFVLIALIIFSPWMIRNTIWTGNPVYPLYNGAFNPPSDAVKKAPDEEKSSPQNAFWMRRHVYKESFVQTVFIPIRIFFQGQDDNPKYFDGNLNPCLLLLPLMSFLYLGKKQLGFKIHHLNLFCIFSILFILFVLFKTDFRIRYMAPVIPPLVVLSMFGIRNALQFVAQRNGWIKKIGYTTIILMVLYAFAHNSNYIIGQFYHVQPMDYITGKVDRDAYIARYRKEYPTIQYANRTLPEDAKVLCLSIGDRTYYIDRPVHLSENYFESGNGIFEENEILLKLKRHQTTHIIIDKNVFFNWVRFLSAESRAVFLNVFQNHTKLLYEENGVRLLELMKNS